ncbi:MAG: GNAT family N-acetyltransferase [Anaerosomatales bacterium]|nr:GNAT family N-acetyltransferase [Anaerosomatales bacterium]
MADVAIIRGPNPDAPGRIVELHASYYSGNWGFGPFFEAKVASGLAEFLDRYDPARDGLWLAEIGGRVEGAIAIDGLRAHVEGAHLRWLIVSEPLQGRGIGGQLLRTAMDFCRERGYPRAYLWTFAGLDAARHLYERAGFKLVEEKRGTRWGTEVLEQKWEWTGVADAGTGGITRIVPATSPELVEVVRELLVEYADSLDVDLCFQDFETELAGLPGDYAPPRGTLLLALDGATPLGCVAVRPLNWPAVAEMKRLYVQPAGRVQGFGRRLAEAAISFARETGYSSMRLDTLPEMVGAIALYESLGLRDTDAYRFNPVEGTRYLELDLR